MEKTRKIFFSTVVLFVCGIIAFLAFSQTNVETEVEYNPLQDECDSIMGYPTSWLGVYIVDLQTGKPIYVHNADNKFRPASTTKLLTSACVLMDIDSNQCFSTKVDINGKIINDSVLNGDIIIVSSTDPLLGTHRYKKGDGTKFVDSIVAKLQALGIRQIVGRIRVDASQYKDWGVPPGWQGNDTVDEYGTPYRTFNYRSNLIYDNKAKNNVVNYRPDTLLINNLQCALSDKGINVLNANDKVFNDKATTIYTHRSLRFADMLSLMMKYSDNLAAEGFLRSLYPKGEREDALKKERRILRKLDVPMPDSLAVLDGSGLSRMNRLSPKFLASLLAAMAKTKYAKTFINLLPRVGMEGTVKNFLKNTPLAGHLRLKTGSLNDVQCYAGYAFADDNAPGTPTHAVVILGNFYPMTRAEFVKNTSNMLLHVFEQ